MNCPKHPHQKMTMLFTSAVCDVCDPPKSSVIQQTTVDDLIWRVPWSKLGFGGSSPFVMYPDQHNGIMTLTYAADLIIAVYAANNVEILKNRWSQPSLMQVMPGVWEDLNRLGVSHFQNPINGQNQSMRLVFVRDKR